MAIDINLFIEYKVPSESDWVCFGNIRCPRQYEVFYKLGGVSKFDHDIAPIAAKRGLPEDYSLKVRGEYFHPVTEDDHYALSKTFSYEEASKAVEEGQAEWMDKTQNKVSDLSSFGASYLSLAEYKRLFEDEDILNACDVSAEYKAILKAMEALEEDGCECRIIFWFIR